MPWLRCDTETSRKTPAKLLGVYKKKQVDTISRAHCWNTLRCVVFIRGIWAASTYLLLSRPLLSQSHRTSLCQNWESPEWLSGGRTLPENLQTIQDGYTLVNKGSNRTCTIYWAVHVGFGGVFPPHMEPENQPFEKEIHLLNLVPCWLNPLVTKHFRYSTQDGGTHLYAQLSCMHTADVREFSHPLK